MRILAFIIDSFVDESTPANNATFIVNFRTSDGSYSSSAMINANVTLTELQIQTTIKSSVASLVNQGIGSLLTDLDVRLF